MAVIGVKRRIYVPAGEEANPAAWIEATTTDGSEPDLETLIGGPVPSGSQQLAALMFDIKDWSIAGAGAAVGPAVRFSGSQWFKKNTDFSASDITDAFFYFDYAPKTLQAAQGIIGFGLDNTSKVGQTTSSAVGMKVFDGTNSYDIRAFGMNNTTVWYQVFCTVKPNPSGSGLRLQVAIYQDGTFLGVTETDRTAIDFWRMASGGFTVGDDNYASEGGLDAEVRRIFAATGQSFNLHDATERDNLVAGFIADAGGAHTIVTDHTVAQALITSGVVSLDLCGTAEEWNIDNGDGTYGTNRGVLGNFDVMGNPVVNA